MSAVLDEAMQRLTASLSILETAVTRRLDAERSRGDLELELQVMQDDRSRLAVELEGSAARLEQLESTADHVGRRVHHAIGSIREVLARAGRLMAQVQVTIAGKSYRMACGDGEEAHLEGLAALLEARIEEMRASFGEIGDLRLQVMASLTLADEVSEGRKRVADLEAELNEMKAQAASGRDESEHADQRMADFIIHTSESIERLTRTLTAGPRETHERLWRNGGIVATLIGRGCGVRQETIPGALSIQTGAVPALVRGLGHTAPTYVVGTRDRIPTAFVAPHCSS